MECDGKVLVGLIALGVVVFSPRYGCAMHITVCLLVSFDRKGDSMNCTAESGVWWKRISGFYTDPVSYFSPR